MSGVIVRGLSYLDVEDLALNRKLIDGSVTAEDLVRLVGGKAGKWWGYIGEYYGSIEDAEEYAQTSEDEDIAPEAYDESAGEDFYGSEIALIFVGEAPVIDGREWTGGTEDAFTGTAEPYLPAGTPVRLLEVRWYSALTGWHTVRANGTMITASKIEDAQPYFDTPGTVDWDPPGMPWEGFWIFAPANHGGAYVGLYDRGRDGDFEDYKLYAGRQPKVAKIEWFQYGERRGEVSMIWTEDLYRELGIATALFNWTKANVLPELHHSPEMTDAGHAWAQSMGYDPENWERVRVRDHWSSIRTANEPPEYGMRHRPGGPGYGDPLHAVTETMYPPDFYDSPQMYSAYDGPGSDYSIRVVQQARGKPEQPIEIFRAIPKDIVRGMQDYVINDGDWVSTALAYAHQHGESNVNDDYAILKATVPARTLWTEANSINEWGYSGPTIPAEIIHRTAAKRTAGTVSEPGVIFRGFGVPFGEAQWEEIKEVEGTDRLAGRVLSYLSQGYFNDRGGLGAHWTIDENIAKNYAYNGRGWPVVVVADWDGAGEDRNTGFGGGQSVGQTWEHEQEVTLLPGTELRLVDIWWGPAMESIVPPGDRLVGFTIRAERNTPMITESDRLLFVRIASLIESSHDIEAAGRGFYKVPLTDWGKGIMELVDQGGFTFQDVAGDAPSTGYMVSVDPQAEKIIPTYDVTPADIGEFMELWGWLVSDPSKYVGGWVYRGKLYLDISTHVSDLGEAARLAKQYGQIAIFDLANMEEIMTDDALRRAEEPAAVAASRRRPVSRNGYPVLIIR